MLFRCSCDNCVIMETSRVQRLPAWEYLMLLLGKCIKRNYSASPSMKVLLYRMGCVATMVIPFMRIIPCICHFITPNFNK